MELACQVTATVTKGVGLSKQSVAAHGGYWYYSGRE